MENQKESKSYSKFVLATAVVVAAVIFGAFVYSGLKAVSMGERVVTVKGKAELIMEADEAYMPITYSLDSYSLQSLLEDNKTKIEVVKDFLKEIGFTDKEISVGNISIEDYEKDNGQKKYNSYQTITVNTKQVLKVRELEKRVSELYDKGIIISRGYYGGRASYDISDINTVKPKLITESMKNAKAAGEQFAKDAESQLGKMKTAWQGQITVNDADATTPHIKKCVVVSTITYYLED